MSDAASDHETNTDRPTSTGSGAVSTTFALGSQWPTLDPFLFCANHKDDYPEGTDNLGPNASLTGHNIGQDFENPDGWNMYHGSTVPGFPQHPHRGFETITYLRDGTLDHADSLGATARLGKGDAQWMTAGSGVQHCEMFPLVNSDHKNPLHLFQIWLNLPAADKMVDAYFTMLWDEEMPRHLHTDNNGNDTEISIIAGALGGVAPPTPPLNSWASRTESDLAVWHIDMAPEATWQLPTARADSNRVLYNYGDGSLNIAAQQANQSQTDDALPAQHGAQVDPTAPLTLTAGPEGAQLILLQGRPIGEPVARSGPFVMNTNAEIQQAYADFNRTRFGGWPWDSTEVNHGPTRGRFALHADGRVEEAPTD